MSAWSVSIPGTAMPHTTFAATRDDALREALDFHGLHFVPDGTTVTPLDDDLRLQGAGERINQGKPQ